MRDPKRLPTAQLISKLSARAAVGYETPRPWLVFAHRRPPSGNRWVVPREDLNKPCVKKLSPDSEWRGPLLQLSTKPMDLLSNHPENVRNVEPFERYARLAREVSTTKLHISRPEILKAVGESMRTAVERNSAPSEESQPRQELLSFVKLLESSRRDKRQSP